VMTYVPVTASEDHHGGIAVGRMQRRT